MGLQKGRRIDPPDSEANSDLFFEINFFCLGITPQSARPRFDSGTRYPSSYTVVHRVLYSVGCVLLATDTSRTKRCGKTSPSVGCSSFVAHDFLVLFYSGPVRPTARRMSDTVGYALTLIRPFQFISFDDAAGFRNEMMCSCRRVLSPSALFERCLRALSPSVLV